VAIVPVIFIEASVGAAFLRSPAAFLRSIPFELTERVPLCVFVSRVPSA
jgi:hypothetical protein